MNMDKWIEEHQYYLKHGPTGATIGSPVIDPVELRELLKTHVIVPREPKMTNEMKATHIGEYSWEEDAPCYDENGDYQEYTATREVPWDLCKQIFKGMYKTMIEVSDDEYR